MPTTSEAILTSDVVVEDRIREDMGDLGELAESIRTYGLIQAIVVERSSLRLVAGGRRLTALKRLGITELAHAVHFIWRDEQDDLQRKAVEIEENLKRKELSWQEQCAGKKRLLELMQSIHGLPEYGRPKVPGGVGFGVNKLSAMLGENISKTIADLRVADAVASFPHLAKAETKGSALNQLRVLSTVVGISLAAKAAQQKVNAGPTGTNASVAVPPQPDNWTLYEGDFRANAHNVLDESVDFIHTDLPYGATVEKMSSHLGSPGFDDSRETALDLLHAIAGESYRTLRDNRYAAYWFGFNYYNDLTAALSGVGFSVVNVPLIWLKNTKSGENPTSRYSNCYEACLIAVKGSPVLMRQGAGNIKTFPTVTDKLHVAEKPTALIEDIIKDLTPPGSVIVDWCAGTGSTGIAALNCKCNAILFEKESAFCRIIRSKLSVASIHASS